MYKVGDKVLFNDNKRFGGVLYNNLKGTIVAIDRKAEEIVFQIQIDKKISDRAIFIQILSCMIVLARENLL